MKQFILFLTLLMLTVFARECSAQDECSGRFQAVIYKGDTIAINCERMVLMNAETFAKYWHSDKQLDELRTQVPEWAGTIDSLHRLHQLQKLELDSINSIREEQIQLHVENQEDLVDMVVDSEYRNWVLFRKNRRLRLISGGSIGLNAVLLLLLLL